MIKYTIEIEGNFITFVGQSGTEDEGIKRSFRKTTIKDIIANNAEEELMLVDVDDITRQYSYKEVADPSTGLAFADLETFRTYILTQLSV